MCEKCAGLGRYFVDLGMGAWELKPCLCESSEFVRQEQERQYEQFLVRFAEAEKMFGEKKTSIAV